MIRSEEETVIGSTLHGPDARPIRKGKLAKPNEFGYVVQIAE